MVNGFKIEWDNEITRMMVEKDSILSLTLTVSCFSISIMVAQFLQKSTYEEVETIVKELLDFAEKCKSLKLNESSSECSQQLVCESSFAFYLSLSLAPLPFSLSFSLTKLQPKHVVVRRAH